MTDLEMTKLCAEAMGLRVEMHPIRGTVMRYWYMEGNFEREYGPLHNDAQAMALVKRFGLVCDPQHDGQDFATDPGWEVWLNGSDDMSINPDLNRAIVECVAKHFAAKESPPERT